MEIQIVLFKFRGPAHNLATPETSGRLLLT